MPELRQNIITREWVIIATERAKRPDQFCRHAAAEDEHPIYDAACPFCPGNEHLSPVQNWQYPEEGPWQIRVVPNLYPALTGNEPARRSINGIYRSMNGIGIHDVVIEHPEHNLIFPLMTVRQISDVFHAFRARYRQISMDERIEAITIFRNHGKSAGTSIVHPHSQIIATPIVPAQIRQRVEYATRYFDDNGECMFCRTLQDELSDGARIIAETPGFVSFIPYAALSPFHIWTFPRRHSASFESISNEEIADIAANISVVLRKLYTGLKNPDFNIAIRSVPVKDNNPEYYHWYLSIIPRVSTAAGFEIGSGMYINTGIPEQSAAFIRDTVINE